MKIDDLSSGQPPSRTRWSEKEAKVIGIAALRLERLRNLLAKATNGGVLAVKGGYGSDGETLTRSDLEACIQVLIEREIAILASYDVDCGETCGEV